MNNPFKAGDSVFIKIKGQQVEATVHQLWNEEVQVRTSDKKLLWRTVKTVTLVRAGVAPMPEDQPKDATPSVDGSKSQPSPLPAKAYSKPVDERPRSGPAIAPTKYKRTRSRGAKKRKI